MENNMMNGELLTTEEVIMEELNRQLEDIDSNVHEEEKRNSGLGILVGGLLVTGALAATAYAMKHPKIKELRKSNALKRARKMNEELGLNISDEELIEIVNAKFDNVEEIILNNDDVEEEN